MPNLERLSKPDSDLAKDREMRQMNSFLEKVSKESPVDESPYPLDSLREGKNGGGHLERLLAEQALADNKDVRSSERRK